MPRSPRLYAPLLCALALGCKVNPPPETPSPDAARGSAPEETQRPAPEASGWAAKIAAIHAAEGGEISATHESRGALSVALGAALPVGAKLSTAASSRLILSLPSGGRVVLDQASELRLGEATRLSKGQALFELIDPEREAQVVTPHGALKLRGAKASVIVSTEGSRVTVARGRVSAEGVPFDAGPGESIFLGTSAPPERKPAPDLGSQVGWAEIDDDEALEAIPRGVGALFAQNPGGGTPRPLAITQRVVEAHIQGPVAYTEITESFRNDSGRTLEGVYRFSLPSGAQISRLSLLVKGKWQEGVFVENKRAERIWKEIIRQWRDPAWLKWQHGDQFELKIFPIEPHSERKVRIGYTLPLKTSALGRRYTYPMPFDPTGEQRVRRFSFTARVDGVAKAGAARVEGYAARVAPTQGGLMIDYRAEGFASTGDLSIRLPPLGDARAELQARAYKDKTSPKDPGYALLTLRPALGAKAGPSAPRDIVIVADTSYSRKGLAADMQARLVERLMREIDAQDRALVLACDARCAPMGHPGLTQITPERAAAALEALKARAPEGTTNPLEAVRVAAAALSKDSAGRDGRIILFTDGVASSGPLEPAALEASARVALGGARLTLVHLGAGGDERAMDALARAGGGAVVTLEPGVSLSQQALTILAYQYGAALEAATLELPEGLTRVYPARLPALADGAELQILARVKGASKGKITLKGSLGGAPWARSWDVSLDPTPDPALAYIPRMWAERHLRALEEADAEGNRKEIVRTSKHHRLVSRHTSLLALESEAMRREFGLTRGRKPHHAEPPNLTQVLQEGMLGAGASSSLDAVIGSAGPSDLMAGSASGLGGLGASGSGLGSSGGGLKGAGLGEAEASEDTAKPHKSAPRKSKPRAEMSKRSGSSKVGDLSDGRGSVAYGKSPLRRKARVRSRIKSKLMKHHGPLDRKVIERVMRRRRRALQSCHERALQRDPSITGKLVMEWSIAGPNGRVIAVKPLSNTSGSSPLIQCVRARIARLRFPKAPDGGLTRVRYTFIFATEGAPSYRRRPPRPTTTLRAPRAPSKAAFARVDALRAQVTQSPDDPNARKRLIRALSQVGDLDGAWREAGAWLDRSRTDIEALLLAAEIRALQGDLVAAERHLRAAVETAPRAEWIQRRLVTALEAQGEVALACAQRVSLEAVMKHKPKIKQDPLACPIASDLSWLGVAALTVQQGLSGWTPKTSKLMRGDLQLELSWTGKADLDLGLIEPGGRLRAWLSGDHRYGFDGVRGQGPERLRAKDLKHGTYRVVVLRRDGGVGPVEATLKAKYRPEGVRKTVKVRLDGRRADALEVVLPGMGVYGGGW